MHSAEDFIERAVERGEGFFLHVYEETNVGGLERSVLNNSTYVPVPIGLNNFRTFYVSRFGQPLPIAIPELRDEGNAVESVASGALCDYLLENRPVRTFLSASKVELEDERQFNVAPLPLDLSFSRGESHLFFGTLENLADRNSVVEVRVIVDDEAVVMINGQAVIESLGSKPPTEVVASVKLANGPNTLRIYYTNLFATGRLTFTTHKRNEQGFVSWSCVQHARRRSDE
jgi:hypothetical protein